MQNYNYLKNVTTLELDKETCTGCTTCTKVCPHGIFVMENTKAKIWDRDKCMECGACALNCPVDAISVTPGVGCASYIIKTWLKGKKAVEDSDFECC